MSNKEKYQEIQKTLSVLSSLVLNDDTESAEKLAEGLGLLDKELKDFLASKPQLEKNELISLMAKIDSLYQISKKQSEKTKKSIINVNKQLKAQKGYGAK